MRLWVIVLAVLTAGVVLGIATGILELPGEDSTIDVRVDITQDGVTRSINAVCEEDCVAAGAFEQPEIGTTDFGPVAASIDADQVTITGTAYGKDISLTYPKEGSSSLRTHMENLLRGLGDPGQLLAGTPRQAPGSLLTLTVTVYPTDAAEPTQSTLSCPSSDPDDQKRCDPVLALDRDTLTKLLETRRVTTRDYRDVAAAIDAKRITITGQAYGRPVNLDFPEKGSGTLAAQLSQIDRVLGLR